MSFNICDCVREVMRMKRKRENMKSASIDKYNGEARRLYQ
jgi:hypothetical protein